ncbi:DUF6020 family protein [Fructobacillus papyrifericola]|nr:DUF6020 family protein [Fructobacillus papyrifericola]
MVSKKRLNVVGLFFAFLALSISYTKELAGSNYEQLMNRLSQSANDSLLMAIVFILILVYQKRLRNTIFERKNVLFLVLGSVASLVYVLTLSVNQNANANLTGKINILVTLVAMVGMAYLFSHLFLLLSNACERINIQRFDIKYSYIVISIVIIWFIQIFPLFPGMVSWDGYRQFVEYFHTHISYLNFTYYPTSHHPWASTLIFGFLFSIGRFVGGTNMGLFTIVLVQVLVAALIYGKIVQYIGNKVGKIPAVVTYLFYVSPFVAFWQVTIEKTPLFIAFTAWFVLSFLKIVLNDYVDKGYFEYFQLIISSILMSAFRNDGAYIVFLSLIVLVLLKSKQAKAFAKNASIVLIVFVITYLSWMKVALPAMNVVAGSTGETITIPMRQLSSVVIHDKKSLNKKDLETIDRITPLDKVKQYYNVDQADNLKSLFPVNSFLRGNEEIKELQSGRFKKTANKQIKKETKDYEVLWIKEFFVHPKIYIITFFQANSQFLNPLADNDPSSRGIMYGNGYMLNNKFLQPSWFGQVHNWTSEKSRKYITWPNILFKLPFIRTILQPAFTLWCVLFSIVYAIYKKSYLVIAILPIFLLTMVPLLSPVNGYERYMLPAMYVMPLLYMILAMISSKNLKDKFVL